MNSADSVSPETAQFQKDLSRRLTSSNVTLLELQHQEETVRSETNFRWMQLILFSVVLLALLAFYIYQRTSISKNYADFIRFINDLRHNGDYTGPGSGYDWAWYFKYPRLAFAMPNINLPAAVVIGYYNKATQDEMMRNRACVQQMYLLAQNRPQATAAQILCSWYMASAEDPKSEICQNLCPPIEPYYLADALNTTLNTTLMVTAASAEVSGGNPVVIGVTLVGSMVLGISQSKHQSDTQIADCEATQQNCVSEYAGESCSVF